MTIRLYYTDAELVVFDAIVKACEPSDERWHVVLDQTAFYPTSGGQPFDTGTLGAAQVLDVIDREDGAVAHVTDRDLPVGARVEGRVAWDRRFDHMQQHTGQHVLSAAFDRIAQAPTVSFHLGAEHSTIDLARVVTPDQIDAAEREANRIVWDNRDVRVRFVSDSEAAGLPLRKPPARSGDLRIVEIDDCDLSACGGTHVTRTGAIGLIAVTSWERFKGGTRLGFACGARARQAHGRLRDIVAALTRTARVSADELAGTVERLHAEIKERRRTIRQLQETVSVQRAEDLREGGETIGPVSVVLRHEPGWDAAALKLLALAIVASPGVVAVLVGDGQPAPIVAARSADVAFDVSAWIADVTNALGGRGGGRVDLAQGGVTAPADQVLAHARQRLESH